MVATYLVHVGMGLFGVFEQLVFGLEDFRALRTVEGHKRLVRVHAGKVAPEGSLKMWTFSELQSLPIS